VNPVAKRWLRFNFVGLVGVGVQLGMLALLVSGLHLGKLTATALAVETAVLHNFVWHELYTWRGAAVRRTPGTLVGCSVFIWETGWYRWR
jgi:putative flippase GtrA